MNDLNAKKEYREGIISVLGCNIWWGIMPIYWQWLKPIDSWVIIFYRIFLVAVVCAIAAWKVHTKDEIMAVLKNRKLVVLNHLLNIRSFSITKTTASMCILQNGSIILWNHYTSANFQKS